MQIQKNNNYVNEIFTNKIYRSFVATLGVLICSLIVFCIFSSYFTICFEFIVDGETIGYSASKSAYDNMVSRVNSELPSDFAQYGLIEKKAITVARFIKNDKLTTEKQLHDNVAALSGYMQNAYTLFVNDKQTISFPTKDELDNALAKFKSSYNIENGNTSILEKIDCVNRYVSISDVYTSDNAQEYFKNNEIIHVQTQANITYTEPLGYEEKIVDDSTRYKGETVITQTGQNGEKTINAQLLNINGVEKSRNIVAEIVSKEPVTQIVALGIKEKPKGIGTGTFGFPTMGIISSRYGMRFGQMHKGIDVANKTGTDIYSADNGVVCFSGVKTGYGNIIIIDHKNGYKTYYGHCSEILKKVGDVVQKGEVIAKMGNTGKSTGPHLHFEIRKDDEPENPLTFVKQ